MAREYLFGVRKKYTSPVRYYLVLLTVNLLFFYLFDGFESYYDSEVFKEFQPPETDEAATLMSEEVQRIQQEIYRYLVFLDVPIITFLTYFFFRKSKLTLVDHAALSLYVLAQCLIFGIIGQIISSIFPLTSLLFLAIISISYYSWFFRDAFNQSWTMTIFKTFGILISSLIVFGILIVTIAIIWAFIILHSNEHAPKSEAVNQEQVSG